jgi:hypothetical protein
MCHPLETKWFHSLSNDFLSREITYKGSCGRDVKAKGSSSVGSNQIFGFSLPFRFLHTTPRNRYTALTSGNIGPSEDRESIW